MKLATWNVNSIRAREERLVRWLEAHQPDVVCLQELKVTDDVFPMLALRSLGYHAAVHGQKTYNGVAVLSRSEPLEVERGFADDGDDAQARLVAACVGGVHVVSAYVPNGQEVGSDKWAYKLEWMRRLRAWLDRRFAEDRPRGPLRRLQRGPRGARRLRPGRRGSRASSSTPRPAPPSRTCARGASWTPSACTTRRRASTRWWDYRMLAFPKGRGLRIDHVLLSEPLAAKCTSARIDRDERKGKQPSDHAPVVVELDV